MRGSFVRRCLSSGEKFSVNMASLRVFIRYQAGEGEEGEDREPVVSLHTEDKAATNRLGTRDNTVSLAVASVAHIQLSMVLRRDQIYSILGASDGKPACVCVCVSTENEIKRGDDDKGTFRSNEKRDIRFRAIGRAVCKAPGCRAVSTIRRRRRRWLCKDLLPRQVSAAASSQLRVPYRLLIGRVKQTPTTLIHSSIPGRAGNLPITNGARA